jgi:uncharacterized membrane protein YdjX (TVP38/TMEM64 family)
MHSRKAKIITALALIPVLVLIGILLFSGGNAQVIKAALSDELSAEEAQEKLRELGTRGHIAVSILAMLQVILTFLPAEPVQVLAGVTFGFPIALAACTFGVFLGNTLIFILYKVYGEKLHDYLGNKLDIDISRAGASGRLALFIFILYFLPAIPYGMICFLAASMEMKYPRYVTVTLLGAIPSVCIGVGLGHIAVSTSWILSVAVFLVLVIILAIVMKKRNQIFDWVNKLLAKNKKSYSTKTVVRKYKPGKLFIPYVVSKMLLHRKIKFKIIRNVEKIERPSIVLCNHGAFIDFVYSGTILRHEAPNFIVARLYFYRRAVKKLLTAFGCFPKSMFSADVESAMNCVRVVKSGGVLAMMPEARLSTAGRFEDIQPSTFSFIKKMGVTVYTIKMAGDYLAKPKWANGIRRGSVVEGTIDLLFTPEDIANLTEAEIAEKTCAALYYDEFEWLKSHPEIEYRSPKMAEGLENILCRCPRCGGKRTLKTDGGQISCDCGLSETVDSRYSLTGNSGFANHLEWYDWQTEVIRKEILEKEDWSLSSKVTLKHASVDGKSLLRVSGKGTCTLTREGLTYRGTEDGEEKEIFFPKEEIYRLLFGAGEDFEIYRGKEIFYFVPKDGRICVEYYIASIILDGLK